MSKLLLNAAGFALLMCIALAFVYLIGGILESARTVMQ